MAIDVRALALRGEVLTTLELAFERAASVRHAVLAMSDARYAVWAARAVTAAGVACVYVGDLGELYDAIATEPVVLLIEDRFDRVPAEVPLAALRTAGATTPALVLSMWRRPALVSRLRALAPIDIVARPFDAAAITALVRAAVRRHTALRPT